MALRRRLQQHPLFTFVLSLAVAASLAVLLYFVISALPYFALGPATDPRFGRANACLERALPGPKLSFAISADGSQVAAASAQAIAVCDQRDGGLVSSEPRGARAVVFDGRGRLWIDRSSAGLERLGADAGAGPIVSLVGTRDGVVALGVDGHLVALRELDDVAAVGEAQWPTPARLTVSADGERVAVVASGGLGLYEAATLKLLLKESPCAVEEANWHPTRPVVWLRCGGKAEGSLLVDVSTGRRDPVLPGAPIGAIPAAGGQWVVPCEGLPCTLAPGSELR